MTTDITTDGPVIWQAENPTIKNTAMLQYPAKPVLSNLKNAILKYRFVEILSYHRK